MDRLNKLVSFKHKDLVVTLYEPIEDIWAEPFKENTLYILVKDDSFRYLTISSMKGMWENIKDNERVMSELIEFFYDQKKRQELDKKIYGQREIGL